MKKKDFIQQLNEIKDDDIEVVIEAGDHSFKRVKVSGVKDVESYDNGGLYEYEDECTEERNGVCKKVKVILIY